MEEVQLKFGLTLGSTAYEGKISSMILRTVRDRIEVPPTGGSLQRSAAPGATYQELIITFRSSHAAASIWAELWDAIVADDGEVAFSGMKNDGAASADNPVYSGTVRVFQLDSFGTAGQMREQTVTLVVTEAGVTRATT